MAKNQAEDRVTRIGLQGADHGLGLGSSLLRLALQPEETLSFFFLLFFFLNLELEILFYSQTNVPHVVRSIDSRPANERSPLIQEKCNREGP